MPSNDLRNLPLGKQRLAGVEFDVRGVIQLGSDRTNGWFPEFPETVKGIRIGHPCQRLHFLHSTRRAAETEGQEIARYVIHYTDGKTQELPILYGQHVRNWWAEGAESTNTPGSALAWTGTNPVSERSGVLVRLFKTVWVNPQPEVPIESVALYSARTASAPFLIALTVE